MPRIPSAQDLPRVGVASDPGVRVPQGGGVALGRASQQFGAVLSDISDDIFAAVERQQKRQDAINILEAEDAFATDNATGLQKFGVESDPSDMETYQKFEKGVTASSEAMKSLYHGKLSEDGRLRLDQALTRNARATIGAAQKMHLDGQQKKAIDLLDKRSTDLALRASMYPDTLDVLIGEGKATLGQFEGVLTPEQERKTTEEMEKRLVGEAVRGWGRSQKDPLKAMQALTKGDLPPGIKLWWDKMAPEAKEKHRKEVLSETSELISMENRLADKEEKAYRKDADALLTEFYLTDDPKQRERLWRTVQALEMDPEKIRTAKAYWQNSGQLGEDTASSVLIAEQAIRDGRITNAGQLFDEYLGKGVGADTLRTRLVPLIEAKTNERFDQASKWLSTKLGIPPNTILGSGTEIAAKRVSEAQAQLLEFQRQNPKGDFWTKAQEIAKGTLAGGNPEAEARLPLLRQQYNEAVKKGQKDQADRLKAVIESLEISTGKKQ